MVAMLKLKQIQTMILLHANPTFQAECARGAINA